MLLLHWVDEARVDATVTVELLKFNHKHSFQNASAINPIYDNSKPIVWYRPETNVPFLTIHLVVLEPK